jgi:hypothetical protein
MNRHSSGKVKRLGQVIGILQTFSEVTDYGLVFTDLTQSQVTTINRVFRDSFSSSDA